MLRAVSDRYLRVRRDGVMQLDEFTIPETRYAYVDYCPDIKPGMFGKLVPGRYEDLAFVPLAREDPGRNNSALFSYQSNSWLMDRDHVFYEEVGLTTEKAIIHYICRQWLTYPVHRSKRFLQLSSPQESDDMIFGGCNGSCKTWLA